MVAFSGPDPIGVLIGAKRPSGTLIQKIAVHPDHRRQGHGRHLLASLSSKLAILGPPRMVAEVPETLAPACALFSAGGYVQEAVLTDYLLLREESVVTEPPNEHRVPDATFVIPVTVDDLSANGLLETHPEVCWERSVETLAARKDAIAGLAVASDERIEAYLLYMERGAGGTELAALRSLVEDGGVRLARLLSQLRARAAGSIRFPRVHPAEVSGQLLEVLGFRPAAVHRRYAATARSH